MKLSQSILTGLFATLSVVQAYDYSPRYWNSSSIQISSSSSCTSDITTTITSKITIYPSDSDQYDDYYTTPVSTESLDSTTIDFSFITTTSVYEDCNYSLSSCSLATTTELVATYETTGDDGSISTATTVRPLPTSESSSVAMSTSSASATPYIEGVWTNGSPEWSIFVPQFAYDLTELELMSLDSPVGFEFGSTEVFVGSLSSFSKVTNGLTDESTSTEVSLTFDGFTSDAFLKFVIPSDIKSSLSSFGANFALYLVTKDAGSKVKRQELVYYLSNTVANPDYAYTTTHATTTCSADVCSTYSTEELVSSYTTVISGSETVVTTYIPLTPDDPTTTLTAVPYTTTEVITTCSDGICSTYTTEELVSSYTTTISGEVTVVTTYVPLTKQELPTTTEIITSCSNNACSTYTTSQLVSSYTTTIDGKATVITSYCPLTDHASTTTLTNTPYTTTEVITACSQGICSTYTTKELVSSYTTTISGEVTVVTTYCPISSTSDSNGLPTTTTKVVTCNEEKCLTYTTTQLVSSYTSTISGEVTVITTYCPLTSSSSAQTGVVSAKGGQPGYVLGSFTTTQGGSETVVTTLTEHTPTISSSTISSPKVSTTVFTSSGSTYTTGLTTYTTTENGAVTIYTTYCPLTSESSTAKISTTVVTGSGSTYTTGLTTYTTTEHGVVTVYTTYCPLSSKEETTTYTKTKTTTTSKLPSAEETTTYTNTKTTSINPEQTTVQLITSSTVSIKIEGTPVISTVVYTSSISGVPVVLTTYSSNTGSEPTLVTVKTASSTNAAASVPTVSQLSENAGVKSSGMTSASFFGLLLGFLFML